MEQIIFRNKKWHKYGNFSSLKQWASIIQYCRKQWYLTTGVLWFCLFGIARFVSLLTQIIHVICYMKLILQVWIECKNSLSSWLTGCIHTEARLDQLMIAVENNHSTQNNHCTQQYMSVPTWSCIDVFLLCLTLALIALLVTFEGSVLLLLSFTPAVLIFSNAVNFNTVPHVVTHKYKIISLMLHNHNFPTAVNHNVGIWHVGYLICDPKMCYRLRIAVLFSVVISSFKYVVICA